MLHRRLKGNEHWTIIQYSSAYRARHIIKSSNNLYFILLQSEDNLISYTIVKIQELTKLWGKNKTYHLNTISFSEISKTSFHRGNISLANEIFSTVEKNIIYNLEKIACVK